MKNSVDEIDQTCIHLAGCFERILTGERTQNGHVHFVSKTDGIASVFYPLQNGHDSLENGHDYVRSSRQDSSAEFHACTRRNNDSYLPIPGSLKFISLEISLDLISINTLQ